MSDSAATLMIPVENQVRELDGKLLLACVAAERGFPVVLGSRAYIHFAADSIPRGVYLAKSMRSLSDKMFNILRKLGHEIVAFDEEGLIRPSDARYYARRMSEVAVRQVSALLAWGPDNAETFERFPAARGVPIHITGNPRVDMLRPDVRPFYDDQVRRIRERFGGFILLNSNFGLFNHYIPNLRLDAPGGEPLDEFTATLAEHRREIYAQFRRMIPELASAFPDRTLLIRPHPVETHAPWLELARGHPNIVVENEGSVVPWLMACEALVQNGCQTAIEGALVGTPIVSFRPTKHERDVELIETVSHQAPDLDTLMETVRSILAGELGPRDHPDLKRDFERHIAALDGPLASERMVDVLEKAGHASRPPPRSPVALRLNGWAHNRLRTVSKRINMIRSEHRNSQDYHAHRFPELSLDEVRARIERLGQQLGRFGNVRARKRSAHLFQIDA